MSTVRSLLCVALALLGAACANKPEPPQWQFNARDALERYQRAWLGGDTRAADAEFALARRSLAATGEAAMVARCSSKVAAWTWHGTNNRKVVRARRCLGEWVIFSERGANRTDGTYWTNLFFFGFSFASKAGETFAGFGDVLAGGVVEEQLLEFRLRGGGVVHAEGDVCPEQEHFIEEGGVRIFREDAF